MVQDLIGYDSLSYKIRRHLFNNYITLFFTIILNYIIHLRK